MTFTTMKELFVIKEEKWRWGHRCGKTWTRMTGYKGVMSYQQLKKLDPVAAEKYWNLWNNETSWLIQHPEQALGDGQEDFTRDDLQALQNKDVDPNSIHGVMTFFFRRRSGGWFAFIDAGPNPHDEWLMFDHGRWLSDPDGGGELSEEFMDEQQKIELDQFVSSHRPYKTRDE